MSLGIMDLATFIEIERYLFGARIYQPMLLSTASANACSKYFTIDTLKANLPAIILNTTFLQQP